MASTFTETTVTVLARRDSQKLGRLVVGADVNFGPAQTAEERYTEYQKACEQDAEAIFSFLQSHLPEETLSALCKGRIAT